MALTSPGVEVTIIDQSQYLPAPTGTIPLVVIATAQNKANPTGTGVAQGTTAANANKLFQITSQRDLVTIYGNPFFYTTTNGTPIQGYELNEYGLLAAYSVLGVSNRCYVLRADIDLASLVGQTGRPTGSPTAGSYWLNTSTTDWGIFTWNATTQKFVEQTPIVIIDAVDLDGNVPAQTLGSPGNYAVNAIGVTTPVSKNSQQQYFYKNDNNQWVSVGSQGWLNSIPTIQATISNPTLSVTGNFTISLSGINTTTIAIASGDSIFEVANKINALGWTFLSAEVISGKLNIFGSQQANWLTEEEALDNSPQYITLSSGVAGLLAQMGLTAGSYNQPVATYGTSAQMPLWSSSQIYPRPNNSVWIKIGASGSGLQQNVAVYNETTATWESQTVSSYSSQNQALASLDPTGGALIPAGTVVSLYQYVSGDYPFGYTPWGSSPVYLKQRVVQGQTIAVGDETTVAITNTGILSVSVTAPNSSTISGPYYVSLTEDDTAADVVSAWYAANIPYTQASVSSTGAIALTHTLGGDIYLNDYIMGASFVGSINGTTLTVSAVNYGVIGLGLFTYPNAGTVNITTQNTGAPGGVGTYLISTSLVVASTSMFQLPAGYGTSNGIISDMGFNPGTTEYVSEWTSELMSYLVEPSSTNGDGAGLSVVISSIFGYPIVSLIGEPGSDYAVGDSITFNGTLFGGLTPANNLIFEVTGIDGSGVRAITYISGTLPNLTNTVISNFAYLDYTANEIAPVNSPANNTNWFYSTVNQVDIMINTSTGWKGYKNVEYDENGFPTPGGTFNTDPNGPLISATEPTTQSDGTVLVYGDLWINTADLELYPLVYRWQSVSGEDKWVLIDNADQVTSSGILFADARWAPNGSTNPASDPIPTIKSLLTSNYLDLDAPDTSLSPVGMLLWNTRRSGYNVKQYRVNYFNNNDFPDQSLPADTDAWVSVSGLQSNGSPYMGRKAQRAMVVQSLRQAIDTNTDIRDEDNAFNLIATPNYPELQPNMVVLNSDRGETGYILGDTPMGLPDSATAIQAWATNAAGATSTGEDGCVTRNTYLGLFYPSGIASDLSGNQVAVPSSHMMLRTFVRNDTIAYPWLAAAGTRRGVIENATNIGYLNRTTGEFQVTKTRIGIRDVLYTNFINPLVFFTGNGLLNYGNKTSFNSQSALDRTNVARLVAYIRRQLTIAARPFVFEPNDSLTRQQIAGVVESLMIDLVAKRGIYDYLVVCDESNNTPSRIDRNELWIDVAVEPVKAAEFIYIPVRILNTGELAAA
jgi:hypothetical protein